MGESLVLDSSRLPVHQRRRQHEILLQSGVIGMPQLQRTFQIIILEPFVVVHQLDEFPFCRLYSIIPEHAGIAADHGLLVIALGAEGGVEVGDIADPAVRRIDSRLRQMPVHDENHLEILEGLALEVFGDILHILVSPGRDDDAEFHGKRRINIDTLYIPGFFAMICSASKS